MNAPQERLDHALEALLEVALEQPRVEHEYEETRAWFRPGSAAHEPTETRDSAARRRHLEWFLLERPSVQLEGVPVEALLETWQARLDEPDDELFEALAGSRASAFEVTTVEPARGLWLRDLAGRGEIPVEEPVATAGLAVGDLLVGRVFLLRDGAYRLSPAVSCFRDRALLDALSGDMERSRAGRRGVLRIQQLDLERLFFGGGAPSTEGAASTALELRVQTAAARRALADLELPDERVEQALGALSSAARRGPGHGVVVTEILNGWAFDTDVDLKEARRILTELWADLVNRSTTDDAASSDAAPDASEDVRAALSEFDRGRAEGRDLEELFRQLETDLGFAPEEIEDTDPIPDFPGVVGAMVEEYLWDLERERGAGLAQGASDLRVFARYARDIGVFENLDTRRLVDFCGRWLLDEGPIEEPKRAHALLETLADFCRWTEERHAHPLWTPFEPSWSSLVQDVPRLLGLRPQLARKDGDADEPFRVVGPTAKGDGLELLSHAGESRTVRVPTPLVHALRSDDLVRMRLEPGSDSGKIVACYPAALRSLLATG